MRQSKEEESVQSLGEIGSALPSTAQSSPYEPLKADRDCTRLLRIEAAQDGDPIACTLFEVAFGDRPKFDALSYMWGDGEAECNITVNGVDYGVRQNLWDALHYLQKYARDTDYWIDAICINQKDLDERNRQVRMMHHIYSRAQTVSVWLGKSYAEYEAALPNLKALQHQKAPNQSAAPGEPADAARNSPAERSLARKLYSDNYWERLWIIQEIAQAQRIKVCFGNSATEWKQFTHFMIMHNLGSDGPIRLERQRDEKYSGSNTLLELLRRHRDAKCQDRKDKVYGLVGLTSDARGFLIDYKKSPFEIWTDVMEFMNRHSLFYDKDVLYVGHLVKFLLMGDECDPLQQIMRPYAPREGDDTVITDPNHHKSFELRGAMLGCVICVGPQPSEIVGDLKAVDSWTEQIQANYRRDLGNAHRDNDMMIRTILELDDYSLSMKCFDCRSIVSWPSTSSWLSRGSSMGDWVEGLQSRSCGAIAENTTSDNPGSDNCRLFQMSYRDRAPWKLGLSSSDVQVGDVVCWFGWPRRAVLVRVSEGEGRRRRLQVVGTAVVAEDLKEERLDCLQRPNWAENKHELVAYLDARTIFVLLAN